MTANEYLLEKLNELKLKYPDIKIRYKHKFESHIIEILPYELYTNPTYMKYEGQLEFEFEELYPDDTILFISDYSLTKI